MIKSEIVIDQHYKDFSPMQFGSETCVSTFPKEVRHTRTEMKLRMRPDIAGFAPFFLVEKVDSYITAP